MLEVINASKTFAKGTSNEHKALDHLNLSLKEGEFVTILGSNGAGKSTLFNAICGNFLLDEGSVILNGKNISYLPEHQRSASIGRLFQDPMKGTAPNMSIEENLALALRRGNLRTLKPGINNNERKLYRDLLLRLGLGLEDRLTSKVGLLSGGQRQALTLLMSTLKRPKLLLLDEHTAALDPKTARKVLELTEEMVNEQHLTALMVTHNMKDAIQIGNRLIMMNSGHVIYDVEGEEKKKLTVEDLLAKFSEASGEEFSNDRMMLAK